MVKVKTTFPAKPTPPIQNKPFETIKKPVEVVKKPFEVVKPPVQQPKPAVVQGGKKLNPFEQKMKEKKDAEEAARLQQRQAVFQRAASFKEPVKIVVKETKANASGPKESDIISAPLDVDDDLSSLSKCHSVIEESKGSNQDFKNNLSSIIMGGPRPKPKPSVTIVPPKEQSSAPKSSLDVP